MDMADPPETCFFPTYVIITVSHDSAYTVVRAMRQINGTGISPKKKTKNFGPK